MNLLSGVRLGVGVELIPDVAMYTLNKLLVYTQPAHLAVAEGVAPDEADLPIRTGTVRAQSVGIRSRAPWMSRDDGLRSNAGNRNERL